MVGRVGASQVNALAVEAEVAGGKAEIPESAAGRLLVDRVGPVNAHPCRHTVQIRIGQLPEAWSVDCQVGLDRRVARGKLPVNVHRGGCFAVSRRRDRKIDAAFLGPRRRIAHADLDVHLANVVLGSGRDEKVVGIDRRRANQFHRIGDAAAVETSPGTERHELGAVGRLVQANPIDLFHAGIQHADCQMVLRRA